MRTFVGAGLSRVAIVMAVGLLLAASVPASVAAAELPRGGTFWDDDGNTHEGMIEAIVAEGITAGCSSDGRYYCPSAPVTRGQMASFLSRALDLPPADRDYFTDDLGATHADNINRIAAAGIAEGRADGTFGADAHVTRAQMATFLSRGLELEAAPDHGFDDVSGVHADSVNRVAQAGITLGCDASGTRFCPSEVVDRAQMASFIGRGLGLEANVPPPRPDVPRLTGLVEPATSSAVALLDFSERNVGGFVYLDLTFPIEEVSVTSEGTVLFIPGSHSLGEPFCQGQPEWCGAEYLLGHVGYDPERGEDTDGDFFFTDQHFRLYGWFEVAGLSGPRQGSFSVVLHDTHIDDVPS